MKTPIFAFYSGCLFITLFFANCLTSKAQCASDFSFDVNDSTNTVRFTNLSTPLSNTSYYWHFGDSTATAEKDPLHVYSQKGVYNVCMTRKDSVCNNTVCKTVQVRPDSCALGFTYTIGPEPWKVSCYNHSAGTADGFIWIWGDVTTTTGLRDAAHNYTFENYFNICLVRKETGLNCPGTICKQVLISGDSCYTDFKTSINQETKTVSFYNNSYWFANTDFTWYFGDGDSSIGSSPVHTYSSLGTHKVCLVKRNAACTDSICKIIELDGRYPCSASFSQQQDSVNHRLIRFVNLSKGRSLSYQWCVGSTGINDTTKDLSHLFPHDGYFDVCLNIQEADSFCNSSMCAKVLIYSDTVGCHAVFTYDAIKDSVNQNTQVTFVNQSPGMHKVSSWNFGDGSTSNDHSPKHTYTQSGMFTVYLAVHDTLKYCTDTLYQFIEITRDTTTGLSDDFSLQHLQLYPVPFTDKLNIKYHALRDQIITVKIINILGSTELTETHSVSGGNHEIEVNTKQLNKGVYFVEVSSFTGSVTRKVIK